MPKSKKTEPDKPPYERDVSSKYGAPMGRPSSPVKDLVGTVHLRRVPMVDGDYDPGGAYWGGGTTPLYCAWDDNGTAAFFRATSRKEAVEAIQPELDDATLEDKPPSPGDEDSEKDPGDLELELPWDVVKECSQPGDASAAVSNALSRDDVQALVASYSMKKIRQWLKEYGYDEDDLEDDDSNLDRFVWISAGNAMENRRR